MESHSLCFLIDSSQFFTVLGQKDKPSNNLKKVKPLLGLFYLFINYRNLKITIDDCICTIIYTNNNRSIFRKQISIFFIQPVSFNTLLFCSLGKPVETIIYLLSVFPFGAPWCVNTLPLMQFFLPEDNAFSKQFTVMEYNINSL